MPSLKEMPSAAMTEKNLFSSRGIKSFLLIPLHLGDDLLGIAGLTTVNSEKEIDENDIEVLTVICELTASNINRVRTNSIYMKEREHFRVTLHSIGDGVITTDTNGNITHINNIAENLTGWTMQEAKGKPVEVVMTIYNSDDVILDSPVRKVLEKCTTMKLPESTFLVSRDGTKRTIDDSCSPIIDIQGEIVGTVIVFRDITEEERKKKYIEYLSYHDKLTGLYNRAFFENELAKIENEKILPYSFIIGDLNGLKLVNDVFGHRAGDQLLVKVTEMLRMACPNGSIIARWGGDEFAIILPGVSNKEARNIRDSILSVCEEAKEDPIKPSIALGVSTKTSSYQDINRIMKEAEDRMYRHKLLESKSARSAILKSLKNTLYERSCETEEHAQRLVGLAVLLGEKLGLSINEQEDLNLLCMLHDIGKIAISDNILTKPGKLTIEEWIEMKKHPEIGYRIAKSSYELSGIAELILCHHERWDGNGYPQGLANFSIPRLSRILAIVDSFDAMTHDRSYQKAKSHNEALLELQKCSGGQFEPKLVDVFIELFS